MKVFLLLPLLCVATLIQAQLPMQVNQPSASFETTEHDFGKLEKTEKGTYAYCEFRVTNTGYQPLIISKCDGSCGCTVPQCSPKPILPGSSSVIKVKYDSSRLGSFTKSVTVLSNAANSPEQILTIKCTVIEM